MAKTLLNGVNEVLKRVQIIQGDSGLLTSLTDGQRQHYIDSVVQMWNEVVDDLYSVTTQPRPNELAEATITLVTDTRNYTLNSALNQLHFPLLDETNGAYITEYPGGYDQMVIDQTFPSNYTGLPLMAAIRPTDGALYMDRAPTSSENGRIYKYRYDKSLAMSLATDTFPFKDVVFRALVPAVSELFKLQHQNKFTEWLYKKSIGTASRYLIQTQQRESWLPVKCYAD